MPILNDWIVHNLDDNTCSTTINAVDGWHRIINKKLTRHNRCLSFRGFIDRIGKMTLLDNHKYNKLLNGYAIGRAPVHNSINDRSGNGQTMEDDIRGFMEVFFE
jgi:hypothetical protein